MRTALHLSYIEFVEKEGKEGGRRRGEQIRVDSG